MRVLRTEMYLPEDHIRDLNRRRTTHAKNPGLGFAWFRTEHPAFDLDERLLERRWYERDYGVAENFLDAAIRGRERGFSLSPADNMYVGSVFNGEIVRAVMDGSIVIENSPPEAVTFRHFLAKAPGVAIGTFIGMRAAGDTTMLMLVTVPAGILVWSSAIGVSKALEKGLNKAVEKLIKRTLR